MVLLDNQHTSQSLDIKQQASLQPKLNKKSYDLEILKDYESDGDIYLYKNCSNW